MFADVMVHVVLPLMNGFIVELMACAAMLIWSAPRRQQFLRRLLTSMILLIAVTVVTHYQMGIVPFVGQGTVLGTWIMAGRFAMLYVGLFLALRVCFVIDVWQSVFVTVAAVAMQHFVYCSTRLITAVTPKPWNDTHTWEGGCLFLAVSIVMGVLGYMLFARRLHGLLDQYGGGPHLLLIFIGVTLCVDIISCFFDGYAAVGGVSDGAYTLMVLTRMLVCVFVLVLLDDIVNRERAERDDAMMQGMLIQQKSQLESDKATIDLINIKAHDMKRQLALLGNRITPEEIEELSRTVNVYDASSHTGNEALDVLLTNRAMICEQRGIKFERIVDGSQLASMRPTDIYSLVGNALDNAIEASSAVEPSAERYISLTIREDKGMTLIHVENPFIGKLTYCDGLPRTTKDDDRYHGFGMRSMRMIAEQYGGTMSVRSADNVFLVNIVLPRQ